ncbi:MAG: pyruvate dehydrogenase component protein, partial [Pseudomonadota bacterium]
MASKNPSLLTAMDMSTPDHLVRHNDTDEQETAEWISALESVLASAGPERARFLLSKLSSAARDAGLNWRDARITPYINTIRATDEPAYPGGSDAVDLEERIASILRWNALAMVVRANRAYGELGGHIASYASAADLFEVGFNHFFRARTSEFGGDLIYFQPHSAPGIYARAFLEGRLSEDNLSHYRQEIQAKERGIQGLSSYPHPWLMP